MQNARLVRFRKAVLHVEEAQRSPAGQSCTISGQIFECRLGKGTHTNRATNENTFAMVFVEAWGADKIHSRGEGAINVAGALDSFHTLVSTTDRTEFPKQPNSSLFERTIFHYDDKLDTGVHGGNSFRELCWIAERRPTVLHPSSRVGSEPGFAGDNPQSFVLKRYDYGHPFH